MSDIEERVKNIVVEHLGVEEAKIQSDSKFIDDLGADSLDTVELVMAFEEEFGCEIPDDAAEKIVVEHLGVEESKIQSDSKFIDDLGADSLDTVELVMAFEEEFGSEISDTEAEKILTVGDAVKFIESKSN